MPKLLKPTKWRLFIIIRNSKLFTMIFSIMATICFIACDDKDDNNKQETNTCTPAACEMVANATEMRCDDAGHCVVKACAEAFKVSEDAKSCEADTPACTCDPGCKEDEDCIKGEDVAHVAGLIVGGAYPFSNPLC